MGRGVAAIAQWIRPRLTSCRPRFEFHLHLSQFIFELCRVEETKRNKKRPGLDHFKIKLLHFSTTIVVVVIINIIVIVVMPAN